MIAVISADLLNSSGYSHTLLEKVLHVLKLEFDILKESGSDFRIYRGDSFQGILKNPEEALRVVLKIKTAINQLDESDLSNKRNMAIKADMKCAIGIGTYDFERESIAEANGQAFQFSGRTLDSMKTLNRKTQLKTPVEAVNEEFNTSLFLFDTLADKWSTASAEVIYYLLKGLKETEIAEELDISQSAVNQRKKAAGWEAINALLLRYEKVISEHFSNGK
ncbi:hypothetical protein C7S20_14040 [Christiangramia fulva]|uniref:Fumarate hydratase n=1 Tax=Christiangramia fulva TaxID=2126553 RepID=A0A2R3Z7W1_9FLAO|nr:hypothetical protein [Christiangramia fulva]AVR46294.1 hypothetical protein C7S20_14040 [Christiangramia fulva]